MKKLIIGLVAVIIIATGLYFILRPRHTAKHITVYQSDVLATNIGYAWPRSGSLNFFTGSNLASLDIKDPATSKTLSPVLPLGQTIKVVWLDNGALVKLNQLSDSDYLLTKLTAAQQDLYQTNSSWWLLTTDGIKLFEYPDIPSANIQDVLVENGQVYLTYTTSGLSSYGVALYDSVSATQPTFKSGNDYQLASLVGASQSTAFVREPSGRITAVGAGGTSTIYSLSSDAKWDSTSKSMVVAVPSSDSTKDTSEQDDDHTHASSYTISVYNPTNRNSSKLLATKGERWFVSNGTLFVPTLKKDVIEINEFNLATKDETIARVEGGKYSADSVANLIADSSYVYLTDNQNNLSILGTNQDAVDQLPPAKLIKTNERTITTDSFTINYNLTSNEAQVFVVNQPLDSAPGVIQSALPSIKTALGDPNQVAIKWLFENNDDNL
jgi:hypothetical protein